MRKILVAGDGPADAGLIHMEEGNVISGVCDCAVGIVKVNTVGIENVSFFKFLNDAAAIGKLKPNG